MTKQNEYEPEYLVSPGEVIGEYIEERAKGYSSCNDWQDDVYQCASEIGMDGYELYSVYDGSLPITPAIAAKLEKLGRPAHFWLNLERDYQADRARLSGISPWRKVEDEQPPKDGSEFLVEYPDGDHELCRWDRTPKNGKGYFVGEFGQEFDEFAPNLKWMPIPKEGE